ncbi:peptide chain release factor N(5)-glutamine methyltransferase [Carboxylicivirga sp. RSCT41]|uniref:peptide chain release factor N(5)-glutamine methyltransferase n=1 Tax=Carboxylicivirga agarovorans TaxID=3417570 RepID=UPI003D334D17
MSGTTIHQFTSKLQSALKGYYPEMEIRPMAKLLLQHVLKADNTRLLLMGNELLNTVQLAQLEEYTEQLKQHIPIQYIIGSTEFYGLEFMVNPAVLIPRPETEELMHWIINDNNNGKRLLDIGTGSGCIAISLKANMPRADVSAWDISEAALQTAQNNAIKLEQDVKFKLTDILNHDPGDEKFDVIVSNPPYVRELEKKMMEANVLEHEPETALFVSDNDPLIFYRAIAQLGQKMLNNNGLLYFEINEYLAAEMTSMLIQQGFINIECRKDLNGKDRMMKAQKS